MGFATGLAVGTAMNTVNDNHGHISPDYLLAIYLVLNGICLLAYLISTIIWAVTNFKNRNDRHYYKESWFDSCFTMEEYPNFQTPIFITTNIIALLIYLVFIVADKFLS